MSLAATAATPLKDEPSLPWLGLGTTLQTSVAASAATPWSVPVPGLATMLHELPFQCKTREPTAQTSSAARASTALRTLPIGGLATMLQLVPFQCSIKVRASPLLR